MAIYYFFFITYDRHTGAFICLPKQLLKVVGRFSNNDLLTGLLGPYQEIRSPIFFVLPELARAVRKSEGFVFLVRTE